MTKEKLIRYGKDYLHDLETACCPISDIHKEFVREAIKALEIVEEFEKAQIITGGRLNGRTYAYKCGLEDGKRKALEQQPCDDIMAIHTQGLDEGIRCAMCTNSMKSDSGCDGGCRVDEDMYKKVMDTIKNQMFSRPTSEDCVSRKAVLDNAKSYNTDGYDSYTPLVVDVEDIEELPPVTPTFPKGATNGDMLTALFGEKALITLDTHNYLKNWWNAPYKRGNENE